ncbi:MAG: hypothetical protein RSE41_01750 [Clostridia bacterium]
MVFGYYERIALFEVLCLNEEVKDLVSENVSTIDIKKYCIENSNETEYQPLIIDGINKVLNGVTTISELKKKIVV